MTLDYLDDGAYVVVAVGQLIEDQLVLVPAVGSFTIPQEREVVVWTLVRAIVPGSNAVDERCPACRGSLRTLSPCSPRIYRKRRVRPSGIDGSSGPGPTCPMRRPGRVRP